MDIPDITITDIEAEIKRRDWERRRYLARTDLFYLLTDVFGRTDINRPWLKDRCYEVQRDPDGHLDLWARNHYKDVWVNEPVATPVGWVRHGDIKVGDWVYGSDGEPVKVLALSERYTDADCYEVSFDDGSKVICGSGHLWEVERHCRRRLGKGRVYREKVVMNTQEMSKRDHKVDNRLAIPVAPALLNIEHILPIDPYVLGLWLGDGDNRSGRITNADAEIWDYIRDAGYELGETSYTGSKAEVRTVYGISVNLRALNLFYNKHIPASYAWANERQRRALLQGLMDSDGHCSFAHTATFCNQHKPLVDDVYDLCQSLGLKPSLYRYEGEKKPYWQVCFQAYAADAPFRIKRKLERCHTGERKNPRRYIVSIERVPTVETSCIQVDAADGIYLVGKSLIPTHNSTVITYAKTIQDIIRSHGDGAMEAKEFCIGIFSHTRPSAKAFLKQIKAELENNQRLKDLFPDVFYQEPRREAPKWSDDEGIIVRRKNNPKEATVEAWGVVDGQPTGKHFDILVYDDIVTRESVNTPEMIDKTTESLVLSYNLGSSPCKMRFIGTRYHFNDTYRELMARGTVKPRIYTATDDGTFQGKPVLLSKEELDQKIRDMGIYVFSSQMLQNPVADSTQGFKREWLRYYDTVNMSRMHTYIIFDPASEKKKTSDYTAAWVIGLGEDNNMYVLDILRDRLNLKERTARLFQWHRKYKPMRDGGVRYEKYGMQADIEHIKSVQEYETYRFDVTEVAGQTPKNDRIKRLMPYFEQGRIFFPRSQYQTDYNGKTEDLVKIFIEEEYMAFPVPIHDDMLDSLARIAEPDLPLLWPKHKEVEKSSDLEYSYGFTDTSWMG